MEHGFDGKLKMMITRHYLLCSGNNYYVTPPYTFFGFINAIKTVEVSE